MIHGKLFPYLMFHAHFGDMSFNVSGIKKTMNDANTVIIQLCWIILLEKKAKMDLNRNKILFLSLFTSRLKTLHFVLCVFIHKLVIGLSMLFSSVLRKDDWLQDSNFPFLACCFIAISPQIMVFWHQNDHIYVYTYI